MNNIVIGHEHTMQQPLEYNALHLKDAPVKCYKSCPCASTLIYSSLKSYVFKQKLFKNRYILLMIQLIKCK